MKLVAQKASITTWLTTLPEVEERPHGKSKQFVSV